MRASSPSWPVLLPVALASLSACRPDAAPTFVDLVRVADVWRSSERELVGACEQGFPAFARTAGEVLVEVPGAERFRSALGAWPGAGDARLGADDLAEPALVRLLLHRYGQLCRAPVTQRARADLSRLAGASTGDVVPRLEEVLRQAMGPSVRSTRRGSAERPVLSFEIEGSDGAAVVLLACLSCRPEDPNGGPPQLLAAIGAFGAVADMGLRLRRPLRLLVCPDTSEDLAACRAGLEPSDERATAAIALDGMQPLVVSWSGEGSWQLALPHQPAPVRRPPEPGTRRAARRGEPPLVVDVTVEGARDQLPSSAVMRLVSRTDAPEDVRQQVEEAVEAMSGLREGALYEVEVQDEAVQVTARGAALPAWQIDQRRNVLWDLAALARLLRVADPPGGAIADMLRVVQRFDGDPFGARLGLHYEDPVGGPLLVAPCAIAVTGDRVQLDLRLYRPPGLDGAEFGARLDEARRRLRAAAGRPLIEVGREVGEPSLVTPSSGIVRVVQGAFEEVTGEPPPAPSGAPRPGLAALLPQAISLRLPVSLDDPNRAAALLVDLAWSLAVAPDEGVRERSSWR